MTSCPPAVPGCSRGPPLRLTLGCPGVLPPGRTEQEGSPFGISMETSAHGAGQCWEAPSLSWQEMSCQDSGLEFRPLGLVKLWLCRGKHCKTPSSPLADPLFQSWRRLQCCQPRKPSPGCGHGRSTHGAARQDGHPHLPTTACTALLPHQPQRPFRWAELGLPHPAPAKLLTEPIQHSRD